MVTLLVVIFLTTIPLYLASVYIRERALKWYDKPFEERHPHLDQEVERMVRIWRIILLALAEKQD